MSSIAKSAFTAIIGRLSAILTTSGYNTNAGNQIYAGVRFFQDDATYPILTVFSGEEIVEQSTLSDYKCDRVVNIEGYVQDASTPTASIEDLIEDVQNAIELTDITLGGLVDQVDYTGIQEIDPPVAGSDIAGVRITYMISYNRTYGS